MKVAIICLGLLVFCPDLSAAGNYSGQWSYQALNAGDTSFKVEQEGNNITFYRVLHPEFEGERYLLEHMYRGTLVGEKVTGRLFVREEGMKEFEFLRAFDGKLAGQDEMVIDQMDLRRIGGQVVKEAEAEVPVAQAPAPAPSKYAKVVFRKPAPPPVKIPELIPVAARVQTTQGRKVASLLAKADGFLQEKNYLAASQNYEAALALDAHKVEALYKLGVSHGSLGTQAARSGKKDLARTHYSKAIIYWTRAIRYDPYNWGARENIRRAHKKLGA